MDAKDASGSATEAPRAEHSAVESVAQEEGDAARRAFLEELAADLPDLPRWVEARGLLLSGRCHVLIGSEGRRSAGYLVLDRDRPLVCAVNRPVASLVEELLHEHPDRDEVLALTGTAEHLGGMLAGWTARSATIHIHPRPEDLPAPEHEARLIEACDAECLAGLPPELARELSTALERAPVAAVLEDGCPVAFCYAVYETEKWWDVSVDTLEAHRRSGYASSAAALLVRHMLERGKQPVWGALDANHASLAMAARYGFRAIDRMIVYTRAGGGA